MTFARCPSGPRTRIWDDCPGQRETSCKHRRPEEGLMLQKHRVIAIALGILFLLSFPLSGQQSYVTRFDLYGGYGFLDSPKVNLFENGFATQFGVRPKTWLSLGVDYTVAAGDLKITPSQLLPALQTGLQAGIGQGILAGLLPPPSAY